MTLYRAAILLEQVDSSAYISRQYIVNSTAYYKPRLLTSKTEYRQNLMHIQPVGACFFVTFCLQSSLPSRSFAPIKESYVSAKLKAALISDVKERNTKLFNLRKRYLYAVDQELDRCDSESICNLTDEELSKVLKIQIQRYDGELYDLLAYCIMPNHVHIVIDTSVQLEGEEFLDDVPTNYKQLDHIMKLIKGASARYINQSLNRRGVLWQGESYDIYIRNDIMLKNVISYVLENPVKAKLCKSWDDFPHSYLKQ